MKKLLILISIFAVSKTYSQDCQKELRGTFTVFFSQDAKKWASAGIEAGIWKGKLSFDIGIYATSRIEDTTGKNELNYIPTAETFVNGYLKAGFLIYRSENGNVINVLSVSTVPQIAYNVYLQPFNGVLIGLSPYYSFENKTAGAVISLRLGM